MLNVVADQILDADLCCLFACLYLLLCKVCEDLQRLFVPEDKLAEDIDQSFGCIESKVLVGVEAPFCEFLKLLQGSVRVVEYFGSHETDFIFPSSTSRNDLMPFVLLV